MEKKNDVCQRIPFKGPTVFPQSRYNKANIVAAVTLPRSQRDWVEKNPNKSARADIVFYLGCYVMETPHLMQEAQHIFRVLNVSHVTVGGPINCCGLIHLYTGNVEASEAFDRRRVELFKSFEPKEVVMWCQSCFGHANLYTTKYLHTPFVIRSIQEFLLLNIGRLRPFFKNLMKRRVALHDHYGRDNLGDTELVRTLLSEVPGLELVELEHNRNRALKCAAGICSRSEERRINKPLWEEAREAKIDILVNFWHACHRTLLLGEETYGFEVKNLITLIADALGLSVEDKYKRYRLWNDIDRIIEDSREVFEGNGYSEAEIRKHLPECLGLDSLNPAEPKN